MYACHLNYKYLKVHSQTIRTLYKYFLNRLIHTISLKKDVQTVIVNIVIFHFTYIDLINNK